MDLNIFKIPQGQVAAVLGISVTEIRARKKRLAEGTDWVRDGNRVLFCDEGVQKMRAALSLPAAPPELLVVITEAGPGLPEKKPGAASAGAPGNGGDTPPVPRRVFHLPDAPPVPVAAEQVRELVVYRRVTNARLLEAHRAGADPNDRSQVVRVQVRDSANFTKGMLLPVRLVQLPDLFEFTGRLPRWLGKY